MFFLFFFLGGGVLLHLVVQTDFEFKLSGPLIADIPPQMKILNTIINKSLQQVQVLPVLSRQSHRSEPRRQSPSMTLS